MHESRRGTLHESAAAHVAETEQALSLAKQWVGIAEELVQSKHPSASSFAWQQQIRVYVVPDAGEGFKIDVAQLEFRAPYGFCFAVPERLFVQLSTRATLQVTASLRVGRGCVVRASTWQAPCSMENVGQQTCPGIFPRVGFRNVSTAPRFAC